MDLNRREFVGACAAAAAGAILPTLGSTAAGCPLDVQEEWKYLLENLGQATPERLAALKEKWPDAVQEFPKILPGPWLMDPFGIIDKKRRQGMKIGAGSVSPRK